MKLNESKKVLVKIAALDDHKKWVLAVESGRVDRVAALVQAGRGKKLGVKGLIAQYEQAARKLYKPKGFTREEIMMSIVLLWIGGNCVGSFAHLAMSLPSVTTARRNALLRPITVSASHPTVSEIEQNIKESIHRSSPELNINHEIDVAYNLDPAPVPQAVPPEGNDNGSRRTRTRGKKRPHLDRGCHGCGEEVSLIEREGGDAIECKGEGCETLWFHLKCVKVSRGVKSWMCPTCLDMGVKCRHM
ncbi:uncharacterized protein LACBIDRAFT_302967 [Laccaria bicolor S238N-H82]|uniref:Predicted protein n=1 Tax=Laccaria bicolor (strain S238N-H82 / ATCC MYA-4686) TaxID=486041 RepID=B0DIQ0_LACBS|nr:uncharacterized protein LACBIDRAFT_302962 [Laccaria bicolor S238N-H82]XP_001883829.1 uncharacterized protein LACBIDRAFT_302967 [Laccaria bicolor S238N-H82]EDR05724.1 predicted protein [Laccaria bicolor S238N-H82]EDR05725.1 predicted protein [Laccaria bicolor S238N-H82]|eukprot:XP_001883828.1 predicted protein [Laccaria bicolor S238N-H82]